MKINCLIKIKGGVAKNPTYLNDENVSMSFEVEQHKRCLWLLSDKYINSDD